MTRSFSQHPARMSFKRRMFPLLRLVPLLAFLTAIMQCSAGNAESFDIVIKGGRIVDGTGAPWYRADVGIKSGRIADIGRIDASEGKEVLIVEDAIVCPGFIDMMGQTATPMMDNPQTALNLLTQGITTINAGEGDSAAPLSELEAKRFGWTTMSEYFALLESSGLPLNVVQTIGHTQIRQLVVGDTDRRPFDEEIVEMQRLTREGMEAGAIGVSTALIYPPAVYADPQEIAAIAKIAGEYGGRYYTHMRNEGDQLLEAIDEAIEIGQLADCPVHIFHLKAAGEHNWGKMPSAIAKIRQARAAGIEIAADIYPYVNNGLGAAALIHPRHFATGHSALIGQLDDPEKRAEIREEIEHTTGWENWYRHAGKNWERIIVGRSNIELYAAHDGESVAAIAAATNQDPWQVFFELVKHDAFLLPQTMSEANKMLAMQQDFVSFCTDVGPSGGDRIAAHPRASGSFPRLFARYVRELGAISLEQAIAQATSVAANEVMARDRGRLVVGLAADVVVFNFDEIQDRATFASPHKLSQGVSHVIVNGQLVLKDGALTSAKPGRVLRGPGYQPQFAASEIASGESNPAFQSFDKLFSEMLAEHRLPGVSVAVSRNGELLFSRGYGYADIATKSSVTPQTLFRIASISKPITAVAILQLVEKGQLELEDKILDVLDLSAAINAAGDRFDPRWRDITIEHLLAHRGGWDRDQSFDAMFQSVRFAESQQVAPPAGPETVIAAMLAQPLDFSPGERYAYSNFGYCLLGRVIENLTGMPYEQAVQESVLAPLGITDMRIGATRLEGRQVNEAKYYHPGPSSSVFKSDLHSRVPSPYGGWYLEAMDAHGGWLATAQDLALFAAAFDHPENCKILRPASIEKMFAPVVDPSTGDDPSYYYSLGWSNRIVSNDRVNHWHNGSLPGTTSVMIRRHDGVNLVAILNTRATPTGQSIASIVDRLLHRAANEVRDWPE